MLRSALLRFGRALTRPRATAPLRLVALAPAALALLVLATTGCQSGGSSAEPTGEGASASATRVETYRVRPRSFVDVIEVTGTVEALSDATVSAQAAGTVIEMVERGERVPEGGVVARLDTVEARAALSQAKARHDLAADTYRRQRPLYRDSIISALEFQQVRSDYTQAKAALEQARKRLENTRVRAPFAGRVETRFVEEGEQVSPGQQVARLLNTRRIRIEAGIPERFAGDIERGSTVQVAFDAGSVDEREGRITFVGSAVDPQSRTFPIEVELPNPERTLKPEMVARLDVVRARLDSALVVPRSAVIRDEVGTDVYVVREESTQVAANRAVELGLSHAEQTVVTSGLEPGDRLIVSGQNRVAEGDPVEVVTAHDALPGDDAR
jgi:RND family efflux transporter MFP subunit